MTEIPSELFYTKEHEWIRQESDGSCVIGITNHAQDSLGDVTFVEMPAVGEVFEKGAVFGVVESVKAASDVYSPLSGEVVEVNSLLEDQPEVINSSPYEDGWFYKLKPTDMDELKNLLSPEDYSEVCED